MGIKIYCISEKNVWDKAAKCLVNRIDEMIKKNKKTTVFLSGGSVVKLYSDIIKYLLLLGSDRMSFSGVKKISSSDNLAFAQVDERFHPENKKQITENRQQITDNRKQELTEDINAKAIEKTGLWRVCRKKNIPCYLISQKGTLASSAAQYNKTISKLFKSHKDTHLGGVQPGRSVSSTADAGGRDSPEVEELDKQSDIYKIAILGIGPDGHTAGLLPVYKDRWDKKKFVVGYENEGKYKYRITLTPFALERIDYAIVVAMGGEKREAIKRTVLKGQSLRSLSFQENINRYPVVILQKVKRVDLFTDQLF